MARPRGSMTTRFWSKVRRDDDGCWRWTGYLMPNGYGQLRTTPGDDGAWGRDYAHRVAWALHFGPVPSDLHVLHRCDHPACVNPAHLFLGTHLDNIADKVRKGRQLAGERVPTARLTATQVREIRALEGVASSRTVAPTYGVHPRTVRDIWRGATWASVPATIGAQ